MFVLSIVIKLLVGLIGIVIVTRILGKKEMAQVTPFDFVYAVILGGVVEESIYDDKVNILHVLLTIVLLGIFIYLLEWVTQKFEKTRPVIKGQPALIVKDGEINIDAMKKEKLEIEQVRELLRQNGVFSISEVKYALLENSGMLSVLPKASTSPVTKGEMLNNYEENELARVLIDEKVIHDNELRIIGKDKDWLMEEIKQRGYDIEDVFYAEWTETDGFYIQPYPQSK